MDDQTTQFLPFHAINEFMRNDFRLEVVRTVLTSLPSLSQEQKDAIDKLTRRFVQVAGFRNSAKAPARMRVKPTSEAFEKQPQLVAAILYAWSSLNPELRQQVYDLLVAREWDVLPPESDRTKFPGFIPVWPKGESFENLNQAFKEKYPDSDFKSDDISLMVVWVSIRLPYSFEGEDEEDKASEEDLEQE